MDPVVGGWGVPYYRGWGVWGGGVDDGVLF